MSVILSMTSMAIALGISAVGGVIAVKEALEARCQKNGKEMDPVETRFSDRTLLIQTLQEHGFSVCEEEGGTFTVETSAGSLRYYQPEKGTAFWVQPFALKNEAELEEKQAELMEEYMVNVQKSTYLLLKQQLQNRQDMELEAEAILEDRSILLTIGVS